MLRTFENVSRFAVGTSGEPGSRTFWIQVRSGNVLISMAAEKGQVAALAVRFTEMLKEVRLAHPAIPRPAFIEDREPLETPIIGEFRIGAIAIFFDEFTEKVQIDLREVNLDVEEEEFFEFDSPLLDNVQIVRSYLNLEQLRGFISRAEKIVNAGRTPCPFCGFPIDPLGHVCARANGYRR